MNTYEISYSDFSNKEEFPLGERRVVATVKAKNGIEAIREALRIKGVDENDIAIARTLGSNKRLVLAGITFTASKLS